MLNENMSYLHEITTNEAFDNDNFPMTGRLTPIGGTSSDTDYDTRSFSNCKISCSKNICFSNISSVHENMALLEEHENLNASLAALTRHVAHVQFRLQQVLSAPTSEDREVK
jgi:hypothetical protein